jgi:hypothetical protein
MMKRSADSNIRVILVIRLSRHIPGAEVVYLHIFLCLLLTHTRLFIFPAPDKQEANAELADEQTDHKNLRGLLNPLKSGD